MMGTFLTEDKDPILDHCEFENGTLIKVDGIRLQYIDRHTLIDLVRRLGAELFDSKAELDRLKAGS